jgi:hypothetical protein
MPLGALLAAGLLAGMVWRLAGLTVGTRSRSGCAGAARVGAGTGPSAVSPGSGRYAVHCPRWFHWIQVAPVTIENGTLCSHSPRPL